MLLSMAYNAFIKRKEQQAAAPEDFVMYDPEHSRQRVAKRERLTTKKWSALGRAMRNAARLGLDLGGLKKAG